MSRRKTLDEWLQTKGNDRRLRQFREAYSLDLQKRIGTRDDWMAHVHGAIARCADEARVPLHIAYAACHLEMPATLARPGTCRYCGCTEQRACMIEDLLGDSVPCSWWDQARTVCSNPKCVREYIASEMEPVPHVCNPQPEAIAR